jgi:hypothetical protein
MPPSRLKPSEVAAEAKRIYMPHILKHYIRDPVTSYFYPDSSAIKIAPNKKSQQRLRVAVVEGDPVDYALGWYQYLAADPAYRDSAKRIPVVNMANEKRAGGDWESGLMAPEECFARRSNLVHALTMPWNARGGTADSLYPISQRGGIYSPQVCMLKSHPTCQQILTCCSCISRRARAELRCVERYEMASCDFRGPCAETKAG